MDRLLTERWLPVPGFDGYYEVSDRGRVRSLDRAVRTRSGRTHRLNGILLRRWETEQGYGRVTLSRDGIEKVRLVHTLVLSAFVGPRPEAFDGCHNDGDPRNCTLDNLRWDTKSSNHLDRVLHGTHNNTRKVACPRDHLLVAPNLVACVAREQYRSCLACSRARAAGQKSKKAGRSFDLRTVADRKYIEIMGAAV